MKKQKVLQKGLSAEIKIWWLLNAAVLVQLIIYIAYILNPPFAQLNNIFLHTIYNLTSLFILVPYHIMKFIFILGLGLNGGSILEIYLEPTYQALLMISTFFLSLATNFVFAKLFSSHFVTKLYKQYLAGQQVRIFVLLAIMIILFAVG